MSPPPARAEQTPFSFRAVATGLAYAKRTLALVYAASRPLTFALFGLTLVGAALPVGVAYAGKRIVDAVVAGSRDATLTWVLLELAIVAGVASVQRGLSLTRSILGARLGVDINVAILEKALSLELRHFEDPEFYDALTKARREASSRPVQLVGDAFQILQNALTLVGYVALLTRYSSWAVAVLVLSTIPATIAEMRLSKLAFRIRNWRSPDSRKLLYLEHVLSNDQHAKEVKLFGIGPRFLGRYTALAEQFYKEDRALALRRAGVTHGLALLATFAFYGAYASMALLAASGKLSLGDMTLYVLAFRQGQQSFQALLGAVGSLYEHNLYMSNLFAFLGFVPGTETKQANGEAATPARHERGIRFENVGFRYPDKESWALRGVDLFVPEGESIALVGENGAGKTTFVKLLTRLYAPTEGRILLDGKDLAQWDRAVLTKRFSVVFQDFARYQLTLSENVGLGSVEHVDDEPRIDRASERGGAKDVVASLPDGVRTQLGRWFAGGVELSGGQWQKVALARAFMREEADILILDEPTAALDANAEHAVFTRFRQLAEGRTTIVISHRFPTVRMADRIFVFEHGRIVETGSHDALVRDGGRYATMFALQAEGYR